MPHQGRDWEGVRAAGWRRNTAQINRGPAEGLCRTHKNALKQSTSNIWLEFCKATGNMASKWERLRSSFAPLFPCSNSKGVRNPRQAGEKKPGTKRNFTYNQAQSIWDWTSLTELKSGSQVKVIWELGFFLWVNRKSWDLNEFLDTGWRMFSTKQIKGTMGNKQNAGTFWIYPQILVYLMYSLHS